MAGETIETLENPGPPSRGISIELRGSWRAVAAIMLGMCVGAIPAYSIGAFVTPVAEDFGWSATEVFGWALTYAIGVVVSAPFIGMLADRIGSRRVVIGGLTALALVLFATSRMPAGLGMFWFLGFATGVASGGTSAITYGRIVAALFDRALGTAFGLMSCGIGLSAVIGPRLMQAIIDGLGWRTAFAAAGILPLLVLPIAWAWLRPAPYRESAAPEPPLDQTGHRLSSAARLPVFWMLAIGTVIYGICAGGVTVNMIPFLTSEGMSRAGAAGALGLLGAATMAGRFGTGVLIDRLQLNPGLFMAGALMLQMGAFLLLAHGSAATVLVAVVIYGLTIGAEADCVAYCTTKLFGRRWFSSIFSVVGHAMLYIGTGTGPVLFSATQEAAGTYQVALHVWTALAALAVPLFLVIARILAGGRTIASAPRPTRSNLLIIN